MFLVPVYVVQKNGGKIKKNTSVRFNRAIIAEFKGVEKNQKKTLSIRYPRINRKFKIEMFDLFGNLNAGSNYDI